MKKEIKILILDDDRLMIALFEKMATSMDITLQKETSYSFLETEFGSVYEEFDLCFIDLYIDGKNSINFFEKNEKLLQKKNCILITTGSEFALFQKALNLGFEEIFQKPFTINVFSKIIKKKFPHWAKE